ncbi:hypothetical protein ACWCOW_37895 [Streptomyces sp. NPDC001939]
MADDELDLAEQLLVGLDLRATTINTAIAALVRDAGVDDRVAGSPLSANVLREVRLGDGSLAVLKLIGEPQSAEAATLAAWTAHRVPCAPLLDHGVGAHVPDVTNPLLGKVLGSELPHAEMAAATATAQVVRLFRRAHLKPPAEVEPLHGFLSPRLHEAVQIWRESGLPPPDDALRVLTDPDIEPVLLHGDAVGFNLLRSGDELALIAPAGVYGPAEFDAARWVARCLAVTGPGAPGRVDRGRAVRRPAAAAASVRRVHRSRAGDRGTASDHKPARVCQRRSTGSDLHHRHPSAR